MFSSFDPPVTLPIDSSSVAFTSNDSARAVLEFKSGSVHGYTVTLESFGAAPPTSVQTIPVFDASVVYFEFTSTIPDSVSFAADVTLTYTDRQLADARIKDEDNLAVFRFEEDANVWSPLSAVVDKDTNSVTFTTHEPGIWTLAAAVTPTVVRQESITAQPTFALHANRPNPFNSTTQIAYDVPDQSNISLTAYNLLGQEVIRLLDQVHSPGKYVATWNGVNSSGHPLASGIYVYKLESSTGLRQTKRMNLLK